MIFTISRPELLGLFFFFFFPVFGGWGEPLVSSCSLQKSVPWRGKKSKHFLSVKLQCSGRLKPNVKNVGMYFSTSNRMCGGCFLQVWSALLKEMPLHSVVKMLGRLTSGKVLEPGSSETQFLCDRIQSETALKQVRLTTSTRNVILFLIMQSSIFRN